MILGPQRLHHLDLLLRAPASIAKVLVEAEEFHLVPTDADAETETPTAQHGQRRRLLRHQHGLPLWQDQDAGGEAKLAGAACKEAEQHERIVEQILRCVATEIPVRPRCRVHPQHMVGRFQKVVAHSFNRLRIVAHHGGIAADVAKRNECAEFHLPAPYLSASSPAFRLSGATAILSIPERSCCSSMPTRLSRLPQPRPNASVNSSCARLVRRIGTPTSRAN